MHSATLSSKFQLSIPKSVREELNLKAGQKFSIITKGDIIMLVPQLSIEEARGMFEGDDPTGYRDRTDRY